jgi:NDP-sugar pyrophosphorylase family protein
MKAMILAAGLGSRLGSITKEIPKCLVPVGKKVMLELVIEKLKKVGVSEIVINLHHLSELVENFIASRNNFGVTIHRSYESLLLDTGGGIKKARPFLMGDEPFFVHNADVYSEIDLKSLYEFHLKHNPMVTLATMNRSTSRPLLSTQGGLLCGYENRKLETGEIFGDEPNPKAVAFTGIQVISPTIFDHLDRYEGAFSSIRAFLDVAKVGHKVLLFDVSSSYWAGIDTPERLQEVRSVVEGVHH